MPGGALAQSVDPPIKSVGPYALVAELGRGGTANVFLAVEREQLHAAPVVLKVLRAYDEDHELRRMFANESQIALRLRHPNVIRTFDTGHEGRNTYLVMEHLNGRPLSKLLRPSGDVPLPLALLVLADALEGLHYAHELRDEGGKSYNIVHRDVSPQNVFVTYDGDVKMLDFGAAKFTDATAATAVGTIKGRLRYMAPEQAAGRPLDRRADIFSMGVMLWQVVHGRHLWGDLDDATVVSRLLRGDMPPSGSPHSDASPALLAACQRALSLEPARRFESAAAFAGTLREELATYGERGSRNALRAHLAARFAVEKERAERVVDVRLRQISTGLTPTGGLPRPRPKLRPWELALLTLTTLVPAACLALLGSLFFVRPHEPPPPPAPAVASAAPSAPPPPASVAVPSGSVAPPPAAPPVR